MFKEKKFLICDRFTLNILFALTLFNLIHVLVRTKQWITSTEILI